MCCLKEMSKDDASVDGSCECFGNKFHKVESVQEMWGRVRTIVDSIGQNNWPMR